MSTSTIVTFAAAVVVAGLVAAPVHAGQRGDRDRGGRSAVAERDAPRGVAVPRAAAAPRGTPQPRAAVVPPARVEQREGQDRGRDNAAERSAPRAAVAPPARAEQRERQDRSRDAGRREPPLTAAPRTAAPPVRVAPPVRAEQRDRYDLDRGGRLGIAPRARFVTPRWRAFSRPYYDFRPRVRIQFGFYVGYPVRFPTAYDYPYPYTDIAPAYGYDGAPSGVPGTGYGGVSFDVTPYDASVYVDGAYAGPVENFYPTSPPLALAAGVHHIDIMAPGYLTMAFDVSIVPGQVIPYRGTLQFVQP